RPCARFGRRLRRADANSPGYELTPLRGRLSGRAGAHRSLFSQESLRNLRASSRAQFQALGEGTVSTSRLAASGAWPGPPAHGPGRRLMARAAGSAATVSGWPAEASGLAAEASDWAGRRLI